MSTDVHMAFDGAPTEASANKIQTFEEIPDLLTMNVPPIDYIVAGLFARNTLTLWAGAGGCSKSFLAQKLAIAVATGTPFLGRPSKQDPVLYLDYENPAYAVRGRLDAMASGALPPLKIWGTWLEHQPPPIGSELLAAIVKKTKPLLIFDPFRFAHGQDENDSTAMMAIMQCLRSYAAAGCAVVILHHLAKAEGSTSRGSTAIRDHVDVAFTQEISPETGLITWKGNKNRFGLPISVCIKPNFDAGTFEVTDSPQFTRMQDELEKLRQVITEKPGLTQTALHNIVRGRKETLLRRLNENIDKLWSVQQGNGTAKHYYPVELFPQLGTTREQRNNPKLGDGPGACSPVPLSYKGNREQPHLPPTVKNVLTCSRSSTKSLPQCPICHGYALYRENSGILTCETCGNGGPVQ